MRPPRKTTAPTLIYGLLCALACPASPARAANPSSRVKAAMNLLEVANYYYQAGQFLKAAKAFREAFAIDPQPELLFQAARAEHLGMDLKSARTHYEQVLVLDRANAKLREDARMYLDQVRASLKTRESLKPPEKPDADDERVAESANPEPSPAVTPVAARAQPRKLAADQGAPVGRTPWREYVGWGAVAVGVLSVALGISAYTDYLTDQRALNALVGQRDQHGKISGISATAYKERQQALDTDARIGVAGLVAGGVVAGVGAALLFGGAAERVSLAPWTGSRGMSAAVSF